jgi:hypothetical protein
MRDLDHTISCWCKKHSQSMYQVEGFVARFSFGRSDVSFIGTHRRY